MTTSKSTRQEAIAFVTDRLLWMRSKRIWPNGLRYPWTDAFGVVLLVSLYEELDVQSYLDDAEWLVADVQRVLGRRLGIRIGEEPDRDGPIRPQSSLNRSGWCGLIFSAPVC